MICFTVPSGWRVWHVGQKSDGRWSAQLYREEHAQVGANGDAFSAYGIAATPQEAIDACLKGPTSEKLFHDNIVNGDGAPMKLIKPAEAAITARNRWTGFLQS